MKSKHVEAFMRTAEVWAECSTAQKLKVGAIIVKDNRIISIGYNGMPSGWSNECETWHSNVNFEVNALDKHIYGTYKTKPEVLHAETNAIAKVARSPESCEGASLFCTHTPCIECAKLIYQSGIKNVYVKNEYKASKGCGLNFLKESGVDINIL